MLFSNPLNHRNTDGIPEPEKSLIERRSDDEVISTHKSRTLARREQSDSESAPTSGEENLPPAPAPRSAETPRDAIRPQFRH